MDEEADLVERARGGSPDGFSGLVRLHQVHVRAYLARFVRNRETIDDLAQETFLAAYRALSAFRGESSVRLWLLGIARNQALIHLRYETRRRSHERESLGAAVAGWVVQDLDGGASSPGGHEREVAALKTCLQSLPETSASLVTEHYFYRRSASDIARRMGKGPGAIWMAIMRVRQALRRCVEERMAVAGGNRE